MDRFEQMATRRELLRRGIEASVAALWVPRGLLWGWAHEAQEPQAVLRPTPPTVAGPFYPVIRPADRDSDLTRLRGHKRRAQGQVVLVAGRVLNVRGEPVRGARIELWQANTFGRYDHPSDPNPAPLDPDFQGFGTQLTDREGRFRFTTIKPGPYPAEGGAVRTPHLHFDVTGHVDRRTTQLFFAGESLNAQDRIFREVPRNREALIAELQPAPEGEDPASRLLQWTVVLPRG
jgi:protocatechuate 3,4-dioxygenase, beta subunit